MIALENDYLHVEILPKGAELQSLFHKRNNQELLWQRDCTFWEKSSPILFPFIGEVRGGSYRYNGTTYNMPKHGFARDAEFDIIGHTKNQVSFLLRSNETTLAMYPFVFELYLHYRLNDSCMSCTYEVRNLGHSHMFFSIGGHPAFQLDLTAGHILEDYYLVFPDDHILKRYFIEEGLLQLQPEWYPLEGIRLNLQKDVFKNDAWVLKDLRSTAIELRNRNEDYYIKLDFTGFPYLGLWAPMDAPFICVEPWCGVNDLEAHTGDLEWKEGVVRLSPFSEWRKTWEVTIGQS